MSLQVVGPEQVAQEIIAQAKHIISDELGRGLKVRIKADNTPVTQIDTRINDVAIELISKQFPDDAIYAEEGNGGGGTSGYTWVIDPIDGTRALEIGMPTYTVCIARVAPDGQPDFSFVYNPSTEEMFSMKRGESALKNGRDIHIGDITHLKQKQIYITSRMPADALPASEISMRIEKAGAKKIITHSLSHGVLLVAEGNAAAAITGAKEPYEFASVKPIIEAAGGIVADLKGLPIQRCDTKLNGFIAAANESILYEVLKLCVSRKEMGTDSEVRLGIIRLHMPEAQTIRSVEPGYANDVYIVDETYVFHFPKSDISKKVLLFEVEVLQRLQGKVRLATSHVQHVEADGSWAQFSYIKGRQYDASTICGLHETAKLEFAADIAKFLFDMNQIVPKEWLRGKIAELPVNRKDDAEYYAHLLELGKSHNNEYAAIYEQWYTRLMSLSENVFSAEEVVVHGDLHEGNFIFGEDDRLSGIFDFGECMLNTVYFELRPLYAFGEDIVRMTIDALGGRFGSISKEAVKTLAIAHEFSILMRLGSPEETPYDKDRGAIARKLLQQWGELS